MEADATHNEVHLKWLSLLKSVAEIGKDSQGRGYLYIKNDEVAVYETKKS